MSTTTIDLRALIASRYTDPSHHHVVARGPFAVDGWLVGTDGSSLLAVYGAPAEMQVRHIDITTALVTDEPVGEVVSLADLLAWAGEPEPLTKVEDRGLCTCECGDEHRLVQTITLQFRGGWLFGRFMDRRRLANLLDGLPGDVVRIHNQDGESAFRFFGDGWRALLMPARPGLDLADDIRFPAERQ
jgi:hypothetical protein